MARGTAVVVAALGLAAAAGSASSNPFGYDVSKPLRFVDRGRISHGYAIRIEDVAYTSGRDRVNGFLLLPPKSKHKLSGVVFVHGSGGDRRELLPLASWLAGRRAIALAITAPSETIRLP